MHDVCTLEVVVQVKHSAPLKIFKYTGAASYTAQGHRLFLGGSKQELDVIFHHIITFNRRAIKINIKKIKKMCVFFFKGNMSLAENNANKHSLMFVWLGVLNVSNMRICLVSCCC